MSAPRRIDSGRGRRWDEDSIRAALSEFLEGWEVWPTAREFAAGGAKSLREVITRVHGAAWWAREMGLPGGDRPLGGVRRWTDETIRAALVEFFGERTTWPTQREFDEAGLHALREALRQYGDAERWAKEMGVELAPRSPLRGRKRPVKSKQPSTPAREWPLWNERRIRSELAAFLGERSDWPRHSEFLAAGHTRLYHAVLVNGGTKRWARRMGVRWVKRPPGQHPAWTEDRIREGLERMLAGRNTWPTAREFRAAGQRPLLEAVRRNGGVSRWARRFGMTVGRSSPRPKFPP
jgi:hypothetical protein